MSIRRQLADDHQVLDRNAFCSGYVDSFGKWNNGFACPKLESEPVFCCGTTTYRYCCTTTPATDPAPTDVLGQNLPLILGVAAGTLITMLIIIIVSCCFCKSCACYRRRCDTKRDRMAASSTSSAVANMYSYPAPLGRRRDPEDVLQDVDEVAVTRPSRTNLSAGIGSLPRTFTSYRTNRDVEGHSAESAHPISEQVHAQEVVLDPQTAPGGVTVSFTDSVGNTSVSTTSDNERQLFIEQSGGLPPPYNFSKLAELEEPLPAPFVHPFSTNDLGSGHYVAGLSPTDDSFYRATKM